MTESMLDVNTASAAGSPAAARHHLGVLLVTLSAMAWSTAGFFTRVIPLDAWTTLFWRGIFGAATGLAFVLLPNAAARCGRSRAWAGPASCSASCPPRAW